MEKEKAIRKATEAYHTGNYERALDLFALADVDYHQDFDVTLYVGLSYARLKNDDKAIELLSIVQNLDYDPIRKNECKLALSYIYTRKERYEDADLLLGQLAMDEDDSPKAATVYSLWGYIAEKKNMIDRAIKRYKKAIEIDPEHKNALNSLGYLYTMENMNFDEALIYLRRAVSLAPKNASYLDSLGWLCYKMGKNKDALGYLERAFEINRGSLTIKEHLDVIREHEEGQ